MDAVLERLDAIIILLQRGAESRSSVEVSTSTRGTDIKAKSYADGLVDQAGTEAADTYLKVKERLVEQGVEAFQRTVKALHS